MIATLVATIIVAVGAVGAVAVAIDAVSAGFGGSAAVASAPTTPVYVVAADGDTMWNIAELHRGAVEQLTYLEALVERNGGAAVAAGQIVWLP